MGRHGVPVLGAPKIQIEWRSYFMETLLVPPEELVVAELLLA
jgi:hypothetical protein